MDGSASFDPRGLTPLTYLWTQTSGPTVILTGPETATPTFGAPNVTKTTDLTFQLVVTNSKGVSSIPSSVIITVTPSFSSPPPTSTPPSSAQDNRSIINSNINSFNNDRVSNHDTSVTNSNIDSYNHNDHNMHLNYQSQNLYNYQNPMCLTVFGSCGTNSGGQSQNMYNGQNR